MANINQDLETNQLSEGGLQEGVASLRGIKRKLHMTEETIYEKGFEQYDIHKVRVTGLLNKGDIMDFDYPSWGDCVRHFDGDFVIDIRFKMNNNNPFPLNPTTFLKNNVWVRHDFFHNLWESVEVLVNGQTLELPFNYDQTARVFDLLSVRMLDEDEENLKTGFGIYRDAKMLPRGSGDTALQQTLADVKLTPDTLPTDTNNLQSATTISYQDQGEYNEIYGKWLAGSPLIRFRGRIKHPLMNDTKFLPPECPIRVRMKLHRKGQLFQGRIDFMPQVIFEDAYFLDKTYKLTPEMASQFANKIFRKNNQIILPIERTVTTEHQLPKGKSVRLNRFFQGTLPRTMALVFIKTNAWKSENPERNPYIYPFLGIRRMRLNYGNKSWPTKDGYEMDLPSGVRPPYNDDQLQTIMRKNWTVYQDNMKVFAGASNVSKLALGLKDWLTYQNVWCFDFTPMGNSAEMQHVSFPKMEGHLDLDLEFEMEPLHTDTYTIVCFSQYDNQFNITVPTWQSERDW